MQNIYETAFTGGASFPHFLAEAGDNRELWHAFAQRVALDAPAASRVEKVGGCWRLLVLADDWCGDAVNTVPVIARLAEAAQGMELRIVPRDRHPELRDRHLTNGSRSIPIVLLLDEAWVPRGSWGPRPGPLQEKFEVELRGLPADVRYREIRKWYARDRGQTTAREFAELVERGAREAGLSEGLPCPEPRVA
ncbi:MAG: thioredoxin family protein [Gemmatimonadales bacterium]|nr:MAG: thioredoxin family protein [Gemmatimonadales bacterium]